MQYEYMKGNLLMDNTNSIGIWGFGKVGKAYIQLLKERGYTQLSVMDKRELTTTEHIFF